MSKPLVLIRHVRLTAREVAQWRANLGRATVRILLTIGPIPRPRRPRP
jgi:hypothetical protein